MEVVNLTQTDVDDASENIWADREKVQIAHGVKVVRHGTMMYLALRETDTEYYDIRPGDRVHLIVDELRKRKRPKLMGDE
jgi:hypothetical protein